MKITSIIQCVAVMVTLMTYSEMANADNKYYYCEAASNHYTIEDGCTDGGLDSNNSGTDFTQSCKSHDICYGNINKSQSQCDNKMLENMLKSCLVSHTKNITEPHKVFKKIIKCRWYGCFPRWKWVVEQITKTTILPGLETCESAAVSYHSAVTTFGGFFYSGIAAVKNEAKQICADASQSTYKYGRAPGLDSVRQGGGGQGGGGRGGRDENCGGNTGYMCP